MPPLTKDLSSSICRLCGEESSELVKIHQKGFQHKELRDCIKRYLDIKITSNDGLPKKICGPCIAKLDDIEDFFKKCINAQMNMKKCLEESQEGRSGVKFELIEETFMKNKNVIKLPPLQQVNSLDETNDHRADLTADIYHDINIASDFVDVTIMKEDSLSTFLEEEMSVEVIPLKSNKEIKTRKLIGKSSSHKCPECPKTYVKGNSLNAHIKTVHKDRMESCPNCNKIYRSKYLWSTHIKTHSTEKKFVCNQCPKTFANGAALRRHLETHLSTIEERARFECEICNKKFVSKKGVRTHMKLHEEVSSFVCDQCGKTFTTKANLLVHYRNHTGERPYECTQCGKNYSHVETYKVHLRSHTGAKPYTCQYCSKSFVSSKILRRHVLIHTGDLPYPCRYCEKGFRDQWKRKIHERIHTGEKPYKCELCPRGFYEKGNLQKHFNNIHKKSQGRALESPNQEFESHDTTKDSSLQGYEKLNDSSDLLLHHTIFF